jgi:linearmycin/streptolysin S transport system permease protein
MARIWAIAVTDLRRMFRVRANFFFAFVFPMLLILVLGATFGGSATPRLGVVSRGTGPLEAQLVNQLERTPHLKVVQMGDREGMISQVARGRLDAGLVVPAGYDTSIHAGNQVNLDYVGRLDQSSQQLAQTVQGAVAREAVVLGAARFAVAEHAAPDFTAGLAAATAASPTVPVVTVAQTVAGKAKLSANLGQFDQSAYTELLLFLFLTALSGSLALIEARRLGLSRRMLSTPTSATEVIAGETLGRLLIGATQAVVIIGGSAVLFGVKWGQPIGVAAVVALFALVAAGAGIFLGTLLRNEQQAIGISIFLGMGFGALGGCMVPLEVFSDTMKHVAHLTPHAWANDAFAKLVGHGASVTGLGTQLGVLAAFAAALLVLSTWRLRRVLCA